MKRPPKSKKPLSVYQRVKRAVDNEDGCLLSEKDCQALYWGDDAFSTRADNDDENDRGIADKDLS